jgi:hypothetical protein
MTRRLLAAGAAVLLLGAYTLPKPESPLTFAAHGGKVAVSGVGFSALAHGAYLDRDNQQLRLFGIDGDPARITWQPTGTEVGQILTGKVLAIGLKDGSIMVEEEDTENIRQQPQKK